MHPWMGLDRYSIAKSMLNKVDTNFNVDNMFEILKATSQEVCPTIVSMVFDISENTVYWCENRKWDNIHSKKLK